MFFIVPSWQYSTAFVSLLAYTNIPSLIKDHQIDPVKLFSLRLSAPCPSSYYMVFKNMPAILDKVRVKEIYFNLITWEVTLKSQY